MSIFKKRYKYYLITYFICYIISLNNSGIPNVYYLIPFKVFAIGGALLMGSFMYYAIEENLSRFDYLFPLIKHIFLLFLIMLVIVLIENFIHYMFGVDISPYIY